MGILVTTLQPDPVCAHRAIFYLSSTQSNFDPYYFHLSHIGDGQGGGGIFFFVP